MRGSPLLFYVSLSARYIDPSEGFNVVVLLWWPLACSLAPPRPVAAEFNIFHAKLFYVPERHHTHTEKKEKICVCREMEISADDAPLLCAKFIAAQ